jgi:hypothetical protein
LTKQNVALKDKILRTQINGIFNDISADENEQQQIIVESLLNKYKKKAIHLFMDKRL